MRPCPCSCCPALTMTGERLHMALNMEPMAFPRPGATCTLQAASLPDARANPSAIATTMDS